MEIQEIVVELGGDVRSKLNSNFSNIKNEIYLNTLLLETDVRTNNYILELLDVGKVVVMNVLGASTLTVPKNDAVDFPIGTIIYICNISSDVVTILGATDVIIRNAGDITQYGDVRLRKRLDNEWILTGNVL